MLFRISGAIVISLFIIGPTAFCTFLYNILWAQRNHFFVFRREKLTSVSSEIVNNGVLLKKLPEHAPIDSGYIREKQVTSSSPVSYVIVEKGENKIDKEVDKYRSCFPSNSLSYESYYE